MTFIGKKGIRRPSYNHYSVIQEEIPDTHDEKDRKTEKVGIKKGIKKEIIECNDNDEGEGEGGHQGDR